VPHFISEIGAGRQTGQQIDRPPLEPAAKRRIATPEWMNQVCFRESPPIPGSARLHGAAQYARVFGDVVRVVGEADIRHFQMIVRLAREAQHGRRDHDLRVELFSPGIYDDKRRFVISSTSIRM